MNTTTTIAKLLAKAAEYEQRARGLRIAADELALEQTQTKHAQLGSQLQTAIKVRSQQRPAKLREQLHATPDEVLARLDLIRQALASGPKSTKQLTAVLQAAGARIGSDRVRQMIHELLGAEVRQSGSAARAVWALKAHRLSPEEKRTRDRERKRKLRAAGTTKATTRAGRQQPQSDMGRVVATVLQKAGKPMRIKQLSQAVKAEGYTKGLTGIANYVRHGYLKHNGTGYSFVAMPPSAASPSA